MRKWVFVAGVAVGYVLGARAGRERYEQIVELALRVRDNRKVRDVAERLQDQAGQAAGMCKDRLRATGIGERLLRERDDSADPDIKPRYWETVGVSSPARDDGNDPRD